MSTFYSDPSRETDPHSLPDLEIWQDHAVTVECHCGDYEVPKGAEVIGCPSCGSVDIMLESVVGAAPVWWGWFCFPGCMPESEVRGPFDSQGAALAALRAEAGE